jgi:ribose 5-phosphate isomerase B
MIIPIASDHAGYSTKKVVKKLLEEMGHMPIDFGTHSGESVDYPDYAVQVARKVNEGEHQFGILICGSGQGMCMTANKFPKIRGALVYNEKIASISRSHNDANILCLPGRELEDSEIKEILMSWFNTSFEGGRHERRINKINSLIDKKK